MPTPSVWSGALTRFTGYTGVTNLLGGRFLSDPDSLEPVMTYLTRRGLLFYDNGAASHSSAPDVAARAGTSFAQATATIDKIQTAMEIDRELSELENAARVHGGRVRRRVPLSRHRRARGAMGPGPSRPGLCSGARFRHSRPEEIANTLHGACLPHA